MTCPECGAANSVPAGYQWCRPCTFSPDGPHMRGQIAAMKADMGEDGYRAAMAEFDTFVNAVWTPAQQAEMKAQTAARLEHMKLERDNPEAAARAELEATGLLPDKP